MPKKDDTAEILKAAATLSENLPIYKDMLQPFAQETGKALGVAGRAVNAALSPLKGIVWGAEKIEEYLSIRLSEKLKGVPVDRIKTPSLLVAGPILESLRFAADNEIVREMYANLLATSMDRATAKSAHPGFVEVIKSMDPDEARIMRYLLTEAKGNREPLVDIRAKHSPNTWALIRRNFSLLGENAKCEYPEMAPSFIDSLIRLGLVEIPTDTWISDIKGNIDPAYDTLANTRIIKAEIKSIENREGIKSEIINKQLRLTDFGRQFGEACVISAHPKKNNDDKT